tara:strand:+ start:470 stop:652 length:183 start_codon:yes stop_codon:yes gene_type:complete
MTRREEVIGTLRAEIETILAQKASLENRLTMLLKHVNVLEEQTIKAKKLVEVEDLLKFKD